VNDDKYFPAMSRVTSSNGEKSTFPLFSSSATIFSDNTSVALYKSNDLTKINNLFQNGFHSFISLIPKIEHMYLYRSL
jgi:hypothetical protein